MIQFTRPSFLNCFTHRCIRDIPNYHETINFVNTLSHLYVNEARIHRHGTRAHMHAHMRAHIVVTTIVTIHAHHTLPSRTRKRLDSRFCITFFIGQTMQSNGIPIHGHRVALIELFQLATHFLFPPSCSFDPRHFIFFLFLFFLARWKRHVRAHVYAYAVLKVDIIFDGKFEGFKALFLEKKYCQSKIKDSVF